MVTKTYTSSIKLAEDTWKYSTLKQRQDIVSALGYDKSFAKPKTIHELVNRNGGFVARDFHNLQKMYLKRNNGSVRITW